jgi:hypothetical protein
MESGPVPAPLDHPPPVIRPVPQNRENLDLGVVAEDMRLGESAGGGVHAGASPRYATGTPPLEGVCSTKSPCSGGVLSAISPDLERDRSTGP